jgi:hypothetical protein
MKLEPIGTFFVDKAWREGADCLASACDDAEITASQLKMVLSRGERTLVRMDREGQTVGWGVVRVDQLPNVRALHITNLVAPHGHFEEFFTEIKTMAASLGCSEVRCSAKPAQARLYSMKCGFVPLYTTMKVEV